MGEFDRASYVPNRSGGPQYGPSFGASMARPLIVAVILGLVMFAGYKFIQSSDTGTGPEPAASDTQLAQIAQRLDELEHRLDQLERRPRASKEVSEPAASSPLVAEAVPPATPTRQLTFSRVVEIPPAASASPATTSPANNAAPPNSSKSERADAGSGQQQWQATADRLGSVVGELDSQRDAIERDRARLDQLSERLAQNSQPFTLAMGSTRQQVGPVWLLLRGTDLRNQRYTMRLSVDDRTVELKDRALHEAIQFYATDGKPSFELVVSQISKAGVVGKLVLPPTTATR